MPEAGSSVPASCQYRP